MKLFELLELLNEAKDELGEDIEVKCFDGYSFSVPSDEYSYSDITDVFVTGLKSYKNMKRKNANSETTLTLYIQWGGE